MGGSDGFSIDQLRRGINTRQPDIEENPAEPPPQGKTPQFALRGFRVSADMPQRVGQK
ncbi:MAG: hypothetical protein ACRER1_02370 [Gammaproteobacteria bacterium]